MAFGRAVNVTLGLPIVRTAVDHGTGFAQGAARLPRLRRSDANRSSRASRIDQRLATLERVVIPGAEPAE